MPVIENKLITRTDWKPGDKPKDGISMCNGMQWEIKNCIVDLTDAPEGSVDEACGTTYGSEAHFKQCVIRGAGKLVLCGCGDESKVPVEKDKVVTFADCILEDFSRRGPEVQDGMRCVMTNCLIAGWGFPEKFDTRAFGAWAHKGGHISAESCMFIKKHSATFMCWLKDHIKHFGQAVKERGFFRALFHRDAWLSGYKRALTAGPDGTVHAMNCYFTKGLVTDSNDNPMSSSEAYKRLTDLIAMKKRLGKELNWDYQGDIDMDAEDLID